ncbi:hypothetical protein GA0074695_2824 [Micromonospora viridifaciens]|uniref:HEAT repeat-containing protein n=1 Tax=Micromonospora viridifaciens TaxID=1881 RepID=A0A1C4WWM4_MICVI|nr:hypothetical protein [Micromonospora viridifaciens]SCF00588.1 hypothetical protein GA0074695_2824 [Micromonospora viridifaciens]
MDNLTDPLAGLDDVPWKSLHHAYGPAVDVPDQLRALRSAEVPVRREALSALFGNVYHQGTRWGASCHVVPFLVALADDPDTPDRAAVADLLRSVVLGDRRDDELPFDPRRAFAAAEGITDKQAALVERHLEAEDLFDHEEVAELADGVAVRWEADAFHAGARHTDRYVRWLTDPDPQLAGYAAELLAWFAPDEAALAGLIAVPDDEAHAATRASANLTLGHCPVSSEPIDACLHQLLAAKAEVVRVTAAVGLAYRLGDQLPDQALDILTDARTSDSDADVPGWDRSVPGFVALALHRLGLG